MLNQPTSSPMMNDDVRLAGPSGGLCSGWLPSGWLRCGLRRRALGEQSQADDSQRKCAEVACSIHLLTSQKKNGRPAWSWKKRRNCAWARFRATPAGSTARSGCPQLISANPRIFAKECGDYERGANCGEPGRV